MKAVIKYFITITFVVLFACGNSTGPSGSDLTPSILSVTFSGHNSMVGSETTKASLSRIVTPALNSEGSESSCCVTVFWTINCDQGFNSYVLFRSETPDISSNTSTAEIIGEFTVVNTSVYVDYSIEWGKEYYYALKTIGSDGNGVWSNEESVIPAAVPTPSVLSLEYVSWSYVNLSWTECHNTNFDTYRLYRMTTPQVSEHYSHADLIYIGYFPYQLTRTDYEVNPSTTYYYALMTTSLDQLVSWSNEVTVNTPYNLTQNLYIGSNPWDICSLPSGDYVYVSISGDNRVSVIRTSDNSCVTTITVGDTPCGICALPSGEFVYVTNWGSDCVSVIRTSDNSVVTTVEVGSRPIGICTLPSGDYVYVTNRYDNKVSVIRSSDNSVVSTVEVGTNPYEICSLPSGEYVYVTNFGSNSISVIRTSDLHFPLPRAPSSSFSF